MKLSLPLLIWLLCLATFLGCTGQKQADGATAAQSGPIPIQLARVITGIKKPTDIQFAPGDATIAVVLEQAGRAVWLKLPGGTPKTLFTVDAKTGGELGLLGLAFHPNFSKNGKFYIDYTAPGGEAALSRIEEWVLPRADFDGATATRSRTILEVSQPYANHNAGQLAFGPDGFLYIGFGDGGSGGDPHGNGQNPKVRLGKMLRVDVDHPQNGLPYGIPTDNPFVGKSGTRPEIWALGLRNPWRYSFAPDGRLVVADVGQNQWEEIDIIEKGGNYGWNRMEGRHCYPPGSDCTTSGLKLPIFEYGHDVGISITGGYVYEGSQIPQLKGMYVFGDLTGSLRAIALPNDASERVPKAVSLGSPNIAISTFGKDNAGELYVADHDKGVVYRLALE